MGITDVQLQTLSALPWMDNYLNHLQKYHEKYGSRDKHPTTEQKLVMFKQLTKKPTKDDRFHITDIGAPSGVESTTLTRADSWTPSPTTGRLPGRFR